MTFSLNKDVQNAIVSISLDIYWISLFTVTGLLFLEKYKVGYVSYYVNLNIIFVMALLSGFIAIVFMSKERKSSKFHWYQWVFSYVFGLCISSYIYWTLKSLPSWAILFSLFFFIAYLIFLHFDTVKNKE